MAGQSHDLLWVDVSRVRAATVQLSARASADPRQCCNAQGNEACRRVAFGSRVHAM